MGGGCGDAALRRRRAVVASALGDGAVQALGDSAANVGSLRQMRAAGGLGALTGLRKRAGTSLWPTSGGKNSCSLATLASGRKTLASRAGAALACYGLHDRPTVSDEG